MNFTWLYVAVVYALVVFVARRLGAALPARVAVLFYLLVLLFLFRPLTHEEVNVHSDYLNRIQPWSLVTNDHGAANPELNDVPLQMVPWAAEVREEWRARRAPLWNERNGSGYPLLANGQSSALSPIRILALPLSLPHAMSGEAAMKILLALTFALLWCRRRASTIASAAGAVTFGFGGFIVVWLHFPHVTTGCFLPAVMYGVDLLCDAMSWKRVTLTALAGAAMIFGGHPETVAHVALLAVTYAVWRVWMSARGERSRLAFGLVATAIATALLAAPFIAPFAEAVSQSTRYASLQAAPYDPAKVPYSNFQCAVDLLQPRIFGDAPAKNLWGPAVTDPVGGFAGVFALTAWLTMLIVVARTGSWRSREGFFVVAAVVLVAAIFAWPGVSHLIHLILPMAANARLRLLLVFAGATLVSAAIDRIPRDRGAAFAAIALTAFVLVALIQFLPFPAGGYRDFAVHAVISSALVLVGAAFLAITRRGAAAGVLLLLIAYDLFTVLRPWNPTLPRATFYPRLPVIAALQSMARSAPDEVRPRIVGQGATLYPNSGAVYGVNDVRAHDPMSNARYRRFLELNAGYPALDYFAEWKDLNARVLDFLNVKWIVTDAMYRMSDSRRFALVYDGPDGRIFENRDVLPRFYAVRNVVEERDADAFDQRIARFEDFRNTALVGDLSVYAALRRDLIAPHDDTPPATCTIVRATPTDYTLHVDARRSSMIVSSIPWWPGWRVEVNGQRVRPARVYGAFLAFPVPPGRDDVRVRYVSSRFRAGLAAAAVALIALTILTLRETRRHVA